MVRLSFPNFANSFQKCHNFYTIQQNVSHPSLFLTHFWDHNMHQSILCWQMRLSSLTTLQAIMPLSFQLMTQEWSLCEKSPHIPSVKSVLPVKLGLTNWNMNLIQACLLLPYNILRLLLYHTSNRVRQIHLQLRVTCTTLSYQQMKPL